MQDNLTPENLTLENFTIDPGGCRLAGRWIKPDNVDPAKPVIVMLHEGLGSIGMWKDFPQKLALATQHIVLVYDRQGYGGSPALTEKRGIDYNHRYALDELPAVLKFCDIDKPILFGHSDGGSIALIHAAHHPVTALITEAAHIFVEEITLAGIVEAEKIWHATDLEKRLNRYHGNKTEEIFFAWAETWQQDEFLQWNLMEELPNIISPSLIIQGADDEYGSPEQVMGIAQNVAGPCETHLIPNCRHIPHLQAEDAVLKVCVDFLGSID